MKSQILIADDNQEIIDLLLPHFEKERFDIIVAHDGYEAIEVTEKNNPTIILLDIMMPKIDGITVCRKIREKSKVPIVMITAKSEDEDVIMGLDIGADDYIIKPFSPKQVVAKVKAILRRLEVDNNKIIRIKNLEINLEEYVVKIDDNNIELTKKEVELIYILAKRPTMVYAREILLETIWGHEYYGDVRNIDSHIKRIRAKLGLNEKKYNWDIKTVWGVGYKFEVSDE